MALRVEVSVATQMLQLWEDARLLKSWPCSTSKFGLGYVEGSNRTPLGHFRVKEKHGDAAPSGTIFKARKAVGVWQGEPLMDDLVLTRILRLEGLQAANANTFDRYIYIHGTNDERRVGQPASHGCVRLKNDAMIELYNLVPAGTEVWIAP